MNGNKRWETVFVVRTYKALGLTLSVTYTLDAILKISADCMYAVSFTPDVNIHKINGHLNSLCRFYHRIINEMLRNVQCLLLLFIENGQTLCMIILLFNYGQKNTNHQLLFNFLSPPPKGPKPTIHSLQE